MVNFLVLFSTLAFGAISNPDRAIVERGYNVLKNSSFESGKSGWVSSGGSFSTSNTSSNVFEGLASGVWDSSGSAQTLTGALVSVNGLAGTNGELTCYVKVPSGTATHTMGIWDGTTLSQAQTLVNSVNNANYVPNTINFVFPSSGSVTVRFTSVLADEVSINIDKCYMGPATNLGQISQASLVGSATIAATACTPTRTSTSLGAFSTDADCPGPTIITNPGPGVIQTTDADLPRFTVNNLPAGTYVATVSFTGNQSGTVDVQTYAITDGTTTGGAISGSANSTRGPYNLSRAFVYTSSGNRTFDIHGASTAGNVVIDASDTSLKPITFSLYRYPSSAEMAVQPSQQNYDWTAYTPTFTGFGTATVANSGDCKHKREGSDLLLDCKFTSGVSTATEARISLPSGLTSASGTKLASIKVAGEMHATSTAIQLVALSEPSVTYLTFAYQDGTNNPLTKVNGNTVFSNGVVYHFNSRLPINGWIQTNANPAIVGQVSSNTSGQERIERSYHAASGGSTCNSTNQSGSWISGCTRNSTGNFTITFLAGIFSSTPVCTCTASYTGLNNGCQIDENTAQSTTTLRVQTNTSGTTAADRNFSIICMGPR